LGRVGAIRQISVQDNYVRPRQRLTGLDPGKHTLAIEAVDPGMVLDRILLPSG
jgi:hypothetical protein